MKLNKHIHKLLIPCLEDLRHQWIIKKVQSIPAKMSLLDVGAGEMPYKQYCRHLQYKSQDLGKYSGQKAHKGLQITEYDSSQVDVLSDISHIPLKSDSFDYILCSAVFEHIPNPFLALTEMNRLNKRGGKLLLAAPTWSFTHFYPYYFYSGFAENFYQVNLPKYGYRIDEIYIYGNFFNCLCVYFFRSVSLLLHYNKFIFIISIPFILLAIPWYFFIRFLSKMYPNSKDIFSAGICVLGTKVTPYRMLCKGAKEKNWNPALKGTERTLAIYDYTTFGMVSTKVA